MPWMFDNVPKVEACATLQLQALCHVLCNPGMQLRARRVAEAALFATCVLLSMTTSCPCRARSQAQAAPPSTQAAGAAGGGAAASRAAATACFHVAQTFPLTAHGMEALRAPALRRLIPQLPQKAYVLQLSASVPAEWLHPLCAGKSALSPGKQPGRQSTEAGGAGGAAAAGEDAQGSSIQARQLDAPAPRVLLSLLPFTAV